MGCYGRDDDHGRAIQSSSRALAWTQQDLADQAEVGIVTVHQLEAGVSQPRRATLKVIREAFERAGVVFIDENGGGPGVRLRKRQRGTRD
jgi:transcriptional regulator with XRE-family HTH domain